MEHYTNKKSWIDLRNDAIAIISRAQYVPELSDDYHQAVRLAIECDSWVRIKEAVQHKLRKRNTKKHYPNLGSDLSRCQSQLNDAISQFHDLIVMLRLKLDD